jgi:uncharacterized membrane protein YphA (DoxX/SURF4 family)
MDALKRLLAHPLLAFVFRVYVGGVFVYASMYKIIYAGEFADTIAGYQILPYWLVGLAAVALPWVELISGALLMLGVRSKSAAAAVGVMLVVFMVAIAVNLVRGTPIGCGCFHSAEEEMSWVTLVRDMVWLLMTVHVYFFDRKWQLESNFSLRFKEAGQ